MNVVPTSLAGAFLIEVPKFQDERGSFIKTFQKSVWQNSRLDFSLEESYYSCSAKNTIRGMHFQTPPHQHAKIVGCPFGKILDVIVDIRKNSPTYSKYFQVELSADKPLLLYIPEGLAHGFLSLTEGAITQYFVSSEYNPNSDSGILYNSLGFEWPIQSEPILSKRDLGFRALKDYNSPFTFQSQAFGLI